MWSATSLPMNYSLILLFFSFLFPFQIKKHKKLSKDPTKLPRLKSMDGWHEQKLAKLATIARLVNMIIVESMSPSSYRRKRNCSNNHNWPHYEIVELV